jgi:hypothetical protein
MPLATELEREVQAMADEFTTLLAPKMSECGALCESTPCGGLSWLLADGAVETGDLLRLDGKNTPCGKLAAANDAFIELTVETRC